MQRLMFLLFMVAVVAGCGSSNTTTTVDAAPTEESAPAGSEVSGAEAIRAELASMRARWADNAPDRYFLVSHEHCPTCDVAPRTNAVIDGVPISLNRDGFSESMELAFDELARTLGHEQYDGHVVAFDDETGALVEWRATFSPVGGAPDETGDSHRVEPFDEEIEDADRSGCTYDGWEQIGASGFQIQVPPDLEDRSAEGVDSEIGEWAAGGLAVTWDYGWYSEPPNSQADQRSFVVHGAHVGLHVDGGQRLTVYVPQVVEEAGEWNALILHVDHPTDGADTARCIVHSIEWT